MSASIEAALTLLVIELSNVGLMTMPALLLVVCAVAISELPLMVEVDELYARIR